jgi:hypothetical protein
LRRQDFDKFTETHERRPSGADVARKAEGFILRENEDAMEAGVDAIGKRDVNDAIESAERDGGFRAVASEGPEPLALSSSEKYTDGIAHIGHGGRLPRQEFFYGPQCNSRGERKAVARKVDEQVTGYSESKSSGPKMTGLKDCLTCIGVIDYKESTTSCDNTIRDSAAR